ncbi:MAG: LacI family DNA-binding transcriptional regulator [Bifidobacterium sp.]|nr:LacI family DNA-binding transcriptional regulator [Bifidobacterium sp.]
MAKSDTVTIRDVARMAGVAVSTASRALGNGSASEATRRKVLDAARQLNFVPNAAARSLPGGQSNTVAIVIDEPADTLFEDEFIVTLLGRVSVALASRELLPFLVLASPEDTEGFTRLLNASGADGVIVASMHEGHAIGQVLREFGRPMVFIGNPPAGMGRHYVDVDNREGGYQAGRCLVERGCRRIAVIEGPKDMTTPRERTEGFKAALRAEGLEPVMSVSGPYTMASGEKGMRKLLAAVPDLDGVFAHSDKIASGAMRVLLENRRAIPDDVAVVGFDDLQVAAMLTPPLTTVAQPLEAVAENAAELLKDYLDTGVWKFSSIRLPAPLVRRQSA